MRKLKSLIPAVLAISAMGAIMATSASAHEWLTLSGSKITKEESTTAPGTLALHIKKISALLGGGEMTLLWDYTLIARVVPGNPDTVRSLTVNLMGGEEDKVLAIMSASTNTICKSGTSVTVEPVGLPWNGEFKFSGSTILEDITKSGGAIGYKFTCSSISIECTGTLELEKFLKNVSTGAELALEELEKLTCTVGEGFASGKRIVEKFLVN